MAASCPSTSSEVASQPPNLTPQPPIEAAPSVIHSVLLANGKRIAISLHFDSAIFSLDRMEEIANLDDLSFVFEPIGDEKKGGMIKFVFQSEHSTGEILSKSARFRAGAMAAATVGGETRVVCQSRGVVEEENSNGESARMEIFVQNVASDEPSRSHHFFYSPNHQFLLTCGRRRFEVDGMVLVPNGPFVVRPSPEIASLHSRSCLSLFYGRDATVLPAVAQSEDPIRIPAISPALLQFGLSLVAFGSKHRLAVPNSQHSMALIRFLDRLAFTKASIRMKSTVLNRILTHDVDVREDSLELIDYVGDDSIRKKFFCRFVFLECLSGLATRYAGRLSMSNLIHLDQRRVHLCSVVCSRPKIRFVFPEGQIVCSLFNDFHSTTVDSLLTRLLIRTSYRAHPLSSRATHGSIPLIDLIHPLPSNHLFRSRVCSLTPAFWLSYSSNNRVNKLFICRGMPDKGLVLGAIVAGVELIPQVIDNMSLVTYVSIVQP